MTKQLFKFLLILILASLTGVNVSAKKEGQLLIDSLLQELPKQKEDTNKVNILNELSYCYYTVDPDVGIKYGQESVALATYLGYKNGLARAYIASGYNYLRKSDNPKALEYYQQSLKLYGETGYKKGIASATSCIGLLYLSDGNYSKALYHFLRALKIYEEIGNKDGIAMACDNIGDTYKEEKNYPKALEYTFTSLKINEEIGKRTGIALSTEGIGEIYERQKNYSQAISYMSKAMKENEALGNRLGVAWALAYIGESYFLMDTALQNARTSDTAINYFQKGLTMGEKIQAIDVMQTCYKGLAAVYEVKRDYKKALEYYQNFIAARDSVFSQENNKKFVRLEYENTHFYDSLKTAQAKNITKLQLKHQRTYTYTSFAIIALLLGFSFFIVKERVKSEKLLLNILPPKVAAELKSKGVTKARQFEHVTVLFTDFVNFTQAGEKMSPQALIDELHTCFKTFDEITARYNIEKIKTIGDAYLAVAGLPVADPEHAEHVVGAAIEINKFMESRYAHLGDKTFQIRIGIHSGSVVAGIVGVKKFAYDIWGDTVNTAARMEQNSEAGKVNISQTTYELVKDKFNCTYRGEIDAKNKGMMRMYYVS
jgi:adenylate cyclase